MVGEACDPSEWVEDCGTSLDATRLDQVPVNPVRKHKGNFGRVAVSL